MLKIRLQRVGRRNDPSFRVVVVNSTEGAQSGKHIELIGHHNPKQDKTQINAERVLYWIRVGAQVSPTLHNLLISQGIIDGEKVNVLPQKSPVQKEASAESAQQAGGGAESETTGAETSSDETEESASDEVTEKTEDGEEKAEEKEESKTEEPKEETETVPEPEEAEAKTS